MRRSPNARGFTLLEMLVALTLIALATSLVAPRFVTLLEATDQKNSEQQFVAAFARLPVRAFTHRQSIAFKANAVADEPSAEKGAKSFELELPADWRVRFDRPLMISSLGVCSDAAGMAFTPAGTRRFRVAAPDCRTTLGR
jgi:prepilin-type N-terminal cleavage/methylation domain-containing protein